MTMKHLHQYEINWKKWNIFWFFTKKMTESEHGEEHVVVSSRQYPATTIIFSSTKYKVSSTEYRVHSTEYRGQSTEHRIASSYRCWDSAETLKTLWKLPEIQGSVLSAKGTQLGRNASYLLGPFLFAVSLLNKGVSSILPSAEFRDRNLNNDNFLISPTKRLKTVRGSQQTRKMVTMQINNQQHLQWHQHLYQAVSSRDATKTH